MSRVAAGFLATNFLLGGWALGAEVFWTRGLVPTGIGVAILLTTTYPTDRFDSRRKTEVRR